MFAPSSVATAHTAQAQATAITILLPVHGTAIYEYTTALYKYDILIIRVHEYISYYIPGILRTRRRQARWKKTVRIPVRRTRTLFVAQLITSYYSINTRTYKMYFNAWNWYFEACVLRCTKYILYLKILRFERILAARLFSTSIWFSVGEGHYSCTLTVHCTLHTCTLPAAPLSLSLEAFLCSIAHCGLCSVCRLPSLGLGGFSFRVGFAIFSPTGRTERERRMDGCMLRSIRVCILLSTSTTLTLCCYIPTSIYECLPLMLRTVSVASFFVTLWPRDSQNLYRTPLTVKIIPVYGMIWVPIIAYIHSQNGKYMYTIPGTGHLSRWWHHQ